MVGCIDDDVPDIYYGNIDVTLCYLRDCHGIVIDMSNVTYSQETVHCYSDVSTVYTIFYIDISGITSMYCPHDDWLSVVDCDDDDDGYLRYRDKYNI